MQRHQHLHIFALSAVGFMVLSSQSHAQDTQSPLTAIYSCATITDNTERLACYDSQVPALKEKEATKEIIAIDAKGVEEIKRDSFGFNLPSLPKLGLFSSNSDKSSKDNQSFKVKSIAKSRNGAIITMENGHVWQQTSGNLGYIPKGNVTATIKPGSFGSYFIRLENDKGDKSGKGARAKRVG